ncbi:MAG: OmpA family protein [Polyangiales bacterium]
MAAHLLPAVVLVLTTIGVCSPARAQRLDLNAFSPPPQPGTTFTIPEPTPQGHGTFHFGIAGQLATGVVDRSVACAADQQPPDLACRGDATRVRAQVPWTSQATLLFELSLFDTLSFGATLPLALARTQWDDQIPETRGGLGDVGLMIAGRILSQGATHLGWQLGASLPTSSEGTFAGEPRITLWPGLALSHPFGRFVLAAQVAYHLRSRQRVLGSERDEALLAKLGGRYVLNPSLAIVGELRFVAGLGDRRSGRQDALGELDLGVRLGHLAAIEVDMGIGSAAWPSDRGLGAPDLRVFAIVRRALGPRACTTGPEDHDGFHDADGCGDPDNDQDGIPDVDDACVNDAEDHDGFQDKDGCPESDNDADGLADTRDLCPENSEDLDGFQDLDGCPEPDNDEDSVADGGDRCRLDPEDRDGFEDEDGCPEPGPARPTVTRAGSRLLISDRVYFEDESDTLRAVSAPLLDALAATFRELPGRPRLRVEGHTDDSGNPQYNVDLSYRRARAVVEYLKRQGIEAERLDYVGHGSAYPLGPNNRPEGRALNRRVEFELISR